MFASNDLLEPSGASQSALRSSVEIVKGFPKGTVSLAVVHPLDKRFGWPDLPQGVKELAEMRVYGLAKKEDIYEVLGVSKDNGSVAVVRPDGYVGMLAILAGIDHVREYLDGCLVRA